MNPQTTLEQLLKQPEGKQLEFKRDLSSPQPLLKTLVAFANTAGGQLIIGVADNGEIVGVDDPLAAEERLTSLITDSIEPRLVPNVELFTLHDKTLMRIEVYLSSSRPHYLAKRGSEQGVLVRVGSTNRQADLQLVEELKRQVMGLSFDALPMPELTLDDLDFPAMQQAFGAAVELNENKLITLKLLVRHQGKLVPSRGAVLLFGRQRILYFDDAWIQCGRFRGLDKVHIFDQTELYDHLPLAIHSIEQFLQKHAYKTAEFGGMQRIDRWSIPITILREAIVNALVHCDYSQRGSPIRVAFYDDRIEIENPGLIMPGLTIEDMKRGVSVIRNPVIARVFRELKLIEQWGSGIQRMFAEAQQQGLPEPIIEEIANRLRVTIPLSRVHSVTQSPTQSPTQSDDKQLFLKLLQDGPKSSSKLREALGLKHRGNFRTQYLDPALAEGWIEMTRPDTPNSRLQKYCLTPAGARLVRNLP